MPDARSPHEDVHVADAVVYKTTGELLLVQRHDHSWWIPGGRVELGETFAEAAVREVAEETGVIVRFSGISCVTETRLRDQHVVFVTCLTEVLGGEAKAPSDDPKVVDVRWVSPDEAEEMLPDFPARSVILRRNAPHIPHFVERPTTI
jgi:8-oxo-dGTP diphosphatase